MQRHGNHWMRRLIDRGVPPAVGIAVLGTTSATARQSAPYYGPHMWNGEWWMVFGPLIMIALIVAIVALAGLLVRWLIKAQGVERSTAGQRPLDILGARFARGEIDKEELDAKRRVLDA